MTANRERLKGPYWREGDRIFWGGRRVAGADPESFIALSGKWAVDARRVFCQGGLVRGAERQSFEVLNAVFARDASSVFWVGGRVKGADPRSFAVLDPGRQYASPGLNGESEESYGRDTQHVYHHTETVGEPLPVRGADRESFVSVDGRWGRDQRHVYLGKSRVRGADPKTWYQLGGFYSRDADHVYYDTLPLNGADPLSFLCLPSDLGTWAQDNQHYYECGRIETQTAYLEALQKYASSLERFGQSVREGRLKVKN